MTEQNDIYESWNPWHGCTKVSPGCKYCYVYRQDEMYGCEVSSSECRKTGNFYLPIKRKRDKSWKIGSGKVVFTCFTSDFLLSDADEWRPECWQMMKQRSDLWFYFFTKRIDRFRACMPDDWGDGYDNVLVGCTVENQEMADYRLPIFQSLPIKHKSIIVAPLIGPVDLAPYLDSSIEEVSVGGESGQQARPCDYAWILAIRDQCVQADIPFRFHQTGACLIKDGKSYRIPRCFQHSQARKAHINYRIGASDVPESVSLEHQTYDLTDLFARLSQSDFRRRFHLSEQDKAYVAEKGLPVIRKHAADFVAQRLAPAFIPNDGKQTPMRGHPVFLAQHATGCCCRGCFSKWHHIPAGRALTQAEQDYAVAVLMAWIEKQM